MSNHELVITRRVERQKVCYWLGVRPWWRRALDQLLGDTKAEREEQLVVGINDEIRLLKESPPFRGENRLTVPTLRNVAGIPAIVGIDDDPYVQIWLIEDDLWELKRLSLRLFDGARLRRQHGCLVIEIERR